MTVQALQNAFLKFEPASPDSPAFKSYQELEQLAKDLSLVEQLEIGQLVPKRLAFALDELLLERAERFSEAKVSLVQAVWDWP
ncbi:MAG: hypothetical protein HC915_20460 [Anaerolineae bacterium]|nr:hypothetical protein [Anaerolineae bacterium]